MPKQIRPDTDPGSPDSWQMRARCRSMDTEIFYQPEHSRGPARRARDERAKAICASCPVMLQCLNWALRSCEPAGIWGGATPEERERLRVGFSRLDSGAA